MKNNIIFVLLVIVLSSCSTLKKKLENQRPNDAGFVVAWARNLDPVYDSGNLPIGFGAPSVHDGILYMGSPSGRMTAYDVKNGKVIWQKDENVPLGAPALVFKDTVVYGSETGRVFARNYLTGDLKFVIDLGMTIESQPVFYESRLFFHLRNHRIVALDSLTGKILWAYTRSVPFTTSIQNVSRPLPIENKILVGFADGHLISFSIEDGSINWEQKLSTGTKFIDVDASPVYKEGLIYSGSLSGPLTVLKPRTGEIVKTIPYTVAKAPFFYQGKTYLITVDGKLVMLDGADQVLNEVKLSKFPLSSIEVWKEKLVVGGVDGKIRLVYPNGLKLITEFDLGHAYSSIFARMTVDSGRLAVYSARNRLYVFR